MKTIGRMLVVTLMLVVALPAFAQFQTGNKLVPLWQAFKRVQQGPSHMVSDDGVNSSIFIGYVMGVSDVSDLRDIELLLATPEMSAAQPCSIVGKYLDSHPEEWHLSGAVIVQKALREAFIKNKKN